MCITKSELESKVQELRGLKAMKEELENELKAVEHEIISYMTERERLRLKALFIVIATTVI